MRKIIAIFFFLILLFNIGGYNFAISAFEIKADRNLEALLDDEIYNEADLVEIRVPLNMPYQQRFTEYERHYGNIEIDGASFTYVKKKIQGDVVIFKCIPNQSRQLLKDMRYDITRANSAADMNEQQGTQKQQQTSFAKNSLSEYDDQSTLPSLNQYNNNSLSYNVNYNFFLPVLNTAVPHQPPEC